uniref:Uncharacterized protein n=1 Tax=Polytomella parva TaxID=51329 RepID=A0A7S0VQ31_9CHLO|mmetsp:Transcript_4981/g.9186  ORF Transcript_4981/g.9186 Transcript_4981/m.9186 type:complete len:416 (+) Transcript_4981:464-1711(+)
MKSRHQGRDESGSFYDFSASEPPRNAESGAVLLDLDRHFDAMHFIWWINSFSDRLYSKFFHGDKETFPLGFAAAGKAQCFYHNKVPPGGVFKWTRGMLRRRAVRGRPREVTGDGYELIAFVQFLPRDNYLDLVHGGNGTVWGAISSVWPPPSDRPYLEALGGHEPIMIHRTLDKFSEGEVRDPAQKHSLNEIQNLRSLIRNALAQFAVDDDDISSSDMKRNEMEGVGDGIKGGNSNDDENDDDNDEDNGKEEEKEMDVGSGGTFLGHKANRGISGKKEEEEEEVGSGKEKTGGKEVVTKERMRRGWEGWEGWEGMRKIHGLPWMQGTQGVKKKLSAAQQRLEQNVNESQGTLHLCRRRPHYHQQQQQQQQCPEMGDQTEGPGQREERVRRRNRANRFSGPPAPLHAGRRRRRRRH